MITSLVVTVNADSRAISHVRCAISEHPDFELGDTVQNRIPVVLEAPDSASAESATRWLSSLPDVVQVDVVFVAFDEVDDARPANEVTDNRTPDDGTNSIEPGSDDQTNDNTSNPFATRNS